MSLPKILTSQECLVLVKEKLLKEETNIEILEQVTYQSKVTILPSLRTESLILFKHLDNNDLYVAKTYGTDIKQILSIEEFKEMANMLPSFEQRNLTKIFNKIDVSHKNKP